MKILIAIDSFKGCLTSIEANNAVRHGIEDVDLQIETISIPLADGGEGTVEALITATQGSYRTVQVKGPNHNLIEARYGILGDDHTAVIEVASACGLTLVPLSDRNPAIATSYGIGELILDAIDQGCSNFIIGLGGSATNDAGVGMLQALGYRFLDKGNNEIGLGGELIKHIVRIDNSNIHPKLRECTFKVACDVNNPLYGPNGAAYVFGPQKGASPSMIDVLDSGLMSFSQVVMREKGIDLQQIEGAGAAGGLGAAFAGFLNGHLQSGIDLITQTLELDEKLSGVDVVITGEGRLDGQTSMGKAPVGIARLANKYGIPVVALAGGVNSEAISVNSMGITGFFSILSEPTTLPNAMERDTAFNNLRLTAGQITRLIRAFKN